MGWHGMAEKMESKSKEANRRPGWKPGGEKPGRKPDSFNLADPMEPQGRETVRWPHEGRGHSLIPTSYRSHRPQGLTSLGQSPEHPPRMYLWMAGPNGPPCAPLLPLIR